MKKNLFFALSIFALLSLVSCQKSIDSPDPGTTPTTPGSTAYLKVGNKWVHNVTGGILPYATITNEITKQNSGIYTLTTKLDATTAGEASVYFENGYINTFDAGQTKGANQQLAKIQNVKVGDKWTRITPTETYYHEAIAINEMVTVPAGTFSCTKIKVTFKNAFNEQITYWNDQYGQIKVDGLLVSSELASKNY